MQPDEYQQCLQIISLFNTMANGRLCYMHLQLVWLKVEIVVDWIHNQPFCWASSPVSPCGWKLSCCSPTWMSILDLRCTSYRTEGGVFLLDASTVSVPGSEIFRLTKVRDLNWKQLTANLLPQDPGQRQVDQLAQLLSFWRCRVG